MKIKVGDRVRNIQSDESGIVHNINNGVIEADIPYVGPRRYWNTDIVEVVQTKEQMEADANDTAKHCDIPILSKLDRIKVRKFAKNSPFELESLKSGKKVFEAMNWDAYSADLAKEVALKVADKYNDPKEAAEYAVSVAKAVVEGLKRK